VGIPVRIGLHWERSPVSLSSLAEMVLAEPNGHTLAVPADVRLTISIAPGSGDRVRVEGPDGRTWLEAVGPIGVSAGDEDAALCTAGRTVRGTLELAGRADTLFVVNVLGLEDYLRGVVPREIGKRPAQEQEAVAAQAIAARTYTVKKLGQYGSLPFDLFADVQDQVYDGVTVEDAVADRAIWATRGLILADRDRLIDAYYSSTCGGRRSDIRAVWPQREEHRSLRGGPDGERGREWCRFSPHFEWEETWTGRELSEIVRRNLPAEVGRASGSLEGELRGLTIKERGPSGRAAQIEYVLGREKWRVLGDRNRWVLRRPDGRILRSVLVEFEIERRGDRIVAVRAKGRGNGHGVGLCQMGAIGRARAGQDFRQILEGYYPGVQIREIRNSDLPPGRVGAL
jgi:stage II sporulation protein D